MTELAECSMWEAACYQVVLLLMGTRSDPSAVNPQLEGLGHSRLGSKHGVTSAPTLIAGPPCHWKVERIA